MLKSPYLFDLNNEIDLDSLLDDVKGKRYVIQTNNQNVFKKYTGIFAMTTEGILFYTIYLKGGIG